MKLEDLSAVIRPRSPWEAVDLGFALVRRHFPRLLVAWFICVGSLWALLLLSSKWVPMGLVLFVIWWLKPLYGRVTLFHLSRSLFGETPTIAATVRAWPGLLFKRLPYALLGGRLSSSRAFLLPVIMLEGLTGRERKARCKVLMKHSGGIASSLMGCCALYEFVLLVALYVLGMMFMPDGANREMFESLLDTGFREGEIPPMLLWTVTGCWLAAITLVEIFYIGGGFGIYLNCRTHLEGWDVEITFRRLGQRLGKVAAVLLLCLVPFFCVESASALSHAVKAEIPPLAKIEAPNIEEETTATDGKKHAAESIQSIKQHEDFKVHKVMRTEWINTAPEEASKPASEFDKSIFEIIGTIIFYIVAGFMLWKLIQFIVKYYGELKRRAPSVETKPVLAPRTLVGLDVAPESLPDDIVRAAWELWQTGNAQGALSLLYRGSLSWFIHSAALPVRDSDTEGDCLRLVKRLDEPHRRDYFSRLTNHWVAVAYADRIPPDTEMETLIRSWPFASRGGGA